MTSLRTTAQRHVQKKVFNQAGLNQATAIERSTSVSTRQRAQFEMYRFDAASYIKDKLGWQVWSGTAEEPGQLQILEAYQKALKQQVEKREYEYDRMALEDLTCYVPGQVIQNRIRVEAGHTVGKCVIISDMITLSDGTRLTAGELIGKTFKLLTLVDGVPTEVKARAEFNAVETVYEIITDTGKRITRNGPHPLFVGDAQFRPGYRPIINARGFTPLQEINPGDLVAVAEELPAFGNSRLPDHKIKLLAYLLGDGGYTRGSVRFSQMEGPQLVEFKECVALLGCVTKYIGQYDWIVYGPISHKKKGANPLLNLLREHDMMSLHSRDKRVPKCAFRFNREDLQLFLNRLFSTDGWAAISTGNPIQREIGFCSASRGLVEDVAYLLQKFGVHARISKKPKVNAWTLVIKDASDQMAFIENIGIFGKEIALDALSMLAAPIRDKKRARIQEREDRPRWCHKNAPIGTRWEKVVSIEALVEPQPTVAIEVPQHHTFLTQFWEHNTKMFSGLVNHFFDCFPPAIIYCFAPGFTQIHDLLFKEIKADRRGKGLPGRILDMGLQIADNHFCIGRATNDAGGKGTERVQGQHGEYLMFVLDEAEGIPDFVYNAVKSMTSGGIAVVLMAANPRTRASTFYKQKELPNVVNFRISCVSHPNVLQDREIVPGAVKRDYVLDMVESNAEPVPEANPDNHTFTLPFPATKGGKVYEAGTHFEPDTEFLFRVLGIAPANSSDNTFIPVGRYEAACKREEELEGDQLRLGVDVARWGNDFGTIWARRGNHAWRVCKVSKQNSFQYVGPIRRTILAERTRGARNVAVRVDGGGGFGSGVVDILKGDEELKKIFGDLFQVFEVNFNGVAQAPKAYHDIATQMYAESAETIKGLCIQDAPKELETDLTARQYKWVNLKGIAVKQLEAKDEFRKRYFRSPDDGDGFVLATAPDFLFRRRIWTFG